MKIGTKHTKKTKDKIRQKAIGRKGYWNGKKRPPFTEKHRKGMSKVKLGKNNPNWKDGITPETIKIRQSIETRLWREAVFARDNWICRKCGERKGFHPHHIKNFVFCFFGMFSSYFHKSW